MTRRRAVGIALALGLAIAACLPAKAHGHGSVARVTWYQGAGWTAGGWYTVEGVTAACSYDIPLGTWISVAGDVYQCQDRGLLGSGNPSWIDVFGGYWVTERYGDYADLAVLE